MTSSSNLDPFKRRSEEEIAERLSEAPPSVVAPAADAAPGAPAAADPADKALMGLTGRALDMDQQRSAAASTMSLKATACLRHVETELPETVHPQTERAHTGFLRSGHESRIG